MIRLILYVVAIPNSFSLLVWYIQLGISKFRARQGLLQKKWSLDGLKLNWQQFSLDIRFKMLSTQMNLVCFFYQCVPNKTYNFKNEKCTGCKHSIVLLNRIAAGNVNGERLPMFVIGKPNILKCFKGAKNVSCCYRAQPKSWISSELFEKWV